MDENTKTLVELDYLPAINYALYQNHVPVLRSLQIKNNSDENWQSVKINITPADEFAEILELHFDEAAAQNSLQIEAIKLKIKPAFINSLTEKMTSSFSLTVKTNDEEIFRQQYDIDLLAYDQWLGSKILPEMLSAFVMPNLPGLVPIIKSAAQTLEKWTGNSSLNEYQSQNADRVKKQMAAIYAAITEKKITYCTVPASFGGSGQRIRLSDAVLATQMGNCLDMSLLYASCLEAIGLHPLLILINGHAFVGAWLVNDTFPDAVNDDPSLLTKRMAAGINEVLLVEATAMNDGTTVSFDDAVRLAENHLIDVNKFDYFIDVHRSRFSGILPLPVRKKSDAGWIIDETIDDKKKQSEIQNPFSLENSVKITQVEKIKFGKQQLWERKLLDLSLRNNLLNLRITRSSLQLIPVSPNDLEDAIAGGEEFQILSRPKDWDNPLRSAGIYQSLNIQDPMSQLVRQELSQKRLRAYLSEEELNITLTSLYRSARQSMEENGANTLYLAIGLLRWYETPSSEKPRFAPILLVPVEIISKSVKKGFIIRSREEDTVLNITLLEKLRQDFGLGLTGLDPLPKDESGVDVKLIFNIIRQTIMSQPRWNVEEQIFLGTFSFSKFIMWNDIHSNAGRMKEHPVISGLLNGQLTSPLPFIPDADLDEQFGHTDILLPINADSSQMQAICAATSDSSFILHGPPGTGKSQTITNIIANALYKGKRVLFVAEKMAALSVVQSRLEAIGLAPFCLELHSNKAKKSEVLAQLQKTTTVIKQQTPENFQAEAERLNELRRTLNQYVIALHKKHSYGYSLYELFNEYIRCGQANDKLPFSIAFLNGLDRTGLINKLDIVERMQTLAALCGNASNRHPLYGIELNQFSNELKDEIAKGLQSFVHARENLLQTLTKVAAILNYPVSQWDDEQLRKFNSLIEKILHTEEIPGAFYRAEKPAHLAEQLLPLIAAGEEQNRLKDVLLNQFQPEILQAAAREMLTQWNVANAKWFLPRYFKQKRIRQNLFAYLRGGTIEKGHIPEILLNAIAYQDKKAIIDTHADYLKNTLEQIWQNGNPDWNHVKESLAVIKDLHSFLISWCEDPIHAYGIRLRIGQLFEHGRQYFMEKEGQLFIPLAQQIQQEQNCRHYLESVLNISLGLSINDGEDVHLNKSKQWLLHLDELRDWFNWTQIRKKALDENLHPAVQAYEAETITTTEIANSFKKSLFRSLAEHIIETEPQLISFNGQYFETQIQKFRELTDHFTQITQVALYAKLAAQVPEFSQGAVATSEAGILQKAIKSNGRGISIRQLFSNIPNLLPRLSPCMLMSPISVAQYLDIHNAPFDLIIFDEASQMPTCEAVGTVARGKNLVVVGDPKQMPPTNFFSSIHFDEEDSNEDLESILDDCHALSVPSRQLSWHYRSQHESLIAFSNMKYYEGSLFTFPSPDDLATRVHFIPIAGTYDRGKTRQNRAEAEAIVKEIVRLLSLSEKERKSIGVVTFSSVQQTLIEDLLNEEFIKNPSLEEINTQSPEPLFIKNLENVQGDERDIILFSICYGPDETGHVALNFGPLNRDGGWRRLNVAVSRARYLMKIYSTLRADQIDLSRTRSEGVAGLKAFLAFAEKGKSALPAKQSLSQDKKALHVIEESIAEALRKKGYEVGINIGCSGYRIDMAVVHPERSSEYLLGILFDGHNYAAAQSARDRNIVQSSVLKQLGWKIFRIWTLDWWRNKDKIMDELFDSITNISNSRNAVEENEALKEPEPVIASQKETPLMNPVIEEEAVVYNNASVIQSSDTTIQNQKSSTPENIPPLYKLTQLPIVHYGNYELFLSYQSTPTITQQIQQVIDLEAPINYALICRRVIAAWGISKLGTRIQSRFEQVFSSIKLNTTEDAEHTITFWKNEQNPADYNIFRLPANESERRNAEDIPAIEVSNAVAKILSNQISMPEDDLIRETAKLFQYARVGGNVEAAMKKGIIEAIRRQKAKWENGRIVFLRN